MKNLEIILNNPDRLVADNPGDIVVFTIIINDLHNKVRSSTMQELLEGSVFTTVVMIEGKAFLFEFSLTQMNIEAGLIEAFFQYDGITNLTEDEHEDETK